VAKAITDPFYPFRVNMRVTIQMHAHDAHEFYFLESGTGSQHTKARSYTMIPSDLYFYRGGIEHECKPGHPNGCRALILYIHPAAFSSTSAGDRDCLMILNALCARTEKTNNRLLLSDKTKKQVRQFLSHMVVDFWKKRPAFACAVKIQVQQLLLSLLHDLKLGAKIKKHFTPVKGYDRINDVLIYLQNYYMNSIPVETCAKIACMSRSHFHAAFQKATDSTFVKYLNRLRIDAAIRLLNETDLPVSHIACRCGFLCDSHFFYTFKRNTGFTPFAMRKLKRIR
jgi:AraC family transcriptional regulator, transcriptional activator of pobA